MMDCNETNLTRLCSSVTTAIRHFALKKLFIINDVKQNIRLMECLSLEKQWKRHLKKHKTSTQAMGTFEIGYHTRKNAGGALNINGSRRVQHAIKQAVHGIRDEVIPLYMTNDIEHRDAWERAHRTTEPFENALLTALMNDTFKVADELKCDMANM